MKALFIFLFLFFAISSISKAAVWPTTAQWSEEFENKYSEWIKNDVTPDFFSNPYIGQSENPYHGIATHCASAVYILRLIFSYENGLPFVIRNPHFNGQPGAQGLSKITNEMTTWDRLKENERLLAFIKFVKARVSTISLGADTYPVALSPQTLRPGAILVYYNDHARFIKDIEPNGVMQLYASTLPEAVRTFSLLHGIPDEKVLRRPHDGLRRWRWPQYIGPLLASPRIPGYSEEQYSIPQFKLDEYVRTKIATHPESYTPSEKVENLFENLCSSVHGRVRAVNEALRHKEELGGVCYTAKDFEDYSTQHRDRNLRVYFKNFEKAVAESLQTDLNNPQVKAVIAKYYRSCVFKFDPDKEYDENSNKRLDLSKLRDRSIDCKLSINPNMSLDARWGEAPEERSSCAVYQKAECDDLSGQ
jgi:hypothetical protein